jgi:hypothetical protein
VGVPYWFLPDEGGTMTLATYEEMADTSDTYLKVMLRRLPTLPSCVADGRLQYAARCQADATMMMCPQDAVPWAFPSNARAPPLQLLRRQRLLSFLRGAAPQRSSSATAAAGSSPGGGASATGQQQHLLSEGSAEPPTGAVMTGGAAAGTTNGMVAGQLPAPGWPTNRQQGYNDSSPNGQPPAGQAPTADMVASPTHLLLLRPAGRSSTDPLPEAPSQHSYQMENRASDAEGSTAAGALSQSTQQHVDSMAAQAVTLRQQHQQDGTASSLQPVGSLSEAQSTGPLDGASGERQT